MRLGLDCWRLASSHKQRVPSGRLNVRQCALAPRGSLRETGSQRAISSAGELSSQRGAVRISRADDEALCAACNARTRVSVPQITRSITPRLFNVPRTPIKIPCLTSSGAAHWCLYGARGFEQDENVAALHSLVPVSGLSPWKALGASFWAQDGKLC
jgi:hypothetical protein